MTDEQIIKALECCAYWENDKSCEDCPANTYDFSCANRMAKYALNFINRRKAEIEQEIKEIKSEAIKDFAERLKRKIWHSGWCNLERTITPEIITNLVKEMTEVQK